MPKATAFAPITQLISGSLGLNAKNNSTSSARIKGNNLADNLAVTVSDQTHANLSWSGTTSGTDTTGTSCSCTNLKCAASAILLADAADTVSVTVGAPPDPTAFPRTNVGPGLV